MKYLAVKYIQEVKDRYGRKHLYFRRAGWPRVKLSGLPGSKEFSDSYSAAMKLAPVPVSPGQSKIHPGSIDALLAKYYQSVDFTGLQPQTQKNYRNVLEKIRPLGPLMVKDITRQDILDIRDGGNSIALIQRIKGLMAFAVDRGFRDTNPAANVKPKGKRKPFRAWTDADIFKFMDYWPADSRQNLAIMLLLYTGARRSDIVTFGWHNVMEGLFVFTPIKTSYLQDGEDRQLIIPIHRVLGDRVADRPKDDPAFLMTEYGKPMSEVGFSNWFSESARKAGLPKNSSPHGLRKAAARRLAEAGCSASQIASITGHSTLKEVERYTASADQAKLARSAMKLLDGGKKDQKKNDEKNKK